VHSSRPFAAKYRGQCQVCGGAISPPEMIIMIDDRGKTAICHEACQGVEPVIDLIEEAKQRQREAAQEARRRKRQRDNRP